MPVGLLSLRRREKYRALSLFASAVIGEASRMAAGSWPGPKWRRAGVTLRNRCSPRAWRSGAESATGKARPIRCSPKVRSRTRRGAGTTRARWSDESRRIRIEIGDRPGIVECDAALSRMTTKELA